MGKMKRFLAFLLALIMVVELVPFNAVEVSATEMQQQNVGTGPNIAAKHTTAASAADITWNYTTALTGSGTTAGKLDARWNATTLFIGVEYTDATTLTVNVGSKQFEHPLAAGGKDVMEISFADAGITLLDYNQHAAFSATLTGSSTASVTDATLHFVIDAGGDVLAAIAASHLQTSGEITVAADGDKSVISMDAAVKNTDGNFQAQTKWSTPVYNFLNAATALRGADMLLEQVFCIEKLPVSAAQVKDSVGAIEGLFFYVTDRTTGSEEDLVVSVHADEEGKLTAMVGNTQAVALGKRLGDTFKLGTRWNLDRSVSIYVDDVLLATVTDATRNYQYSISNEVYGVRYHSTLPGDVKFTVSGPVIKEPAPAGIADSVDAAMLNALVREANPGVDLTAIEKDLILPATVADPYLGNVSITWESSNAAFITNDGKVTRVPGENKEVTLTAKAGAATLGEVTVTVWQDGVVLRDYDIAAQYTAAGDNIAWTYPVSFLANETTPSGGLNAYWDEDNLYIGVQYADAEQLVLTVNGVAQEPRTLATTGEDVATIAWEDANVTLTDYNQVVTLQAVLTDANGNIAQIAETAVNVHLALSSSDTLAAIAASHLQTSGEITVAADGDKSVISMDAAVKNTDGNSQAQTKWNTPVYDFLNAATALRGADMLLEQVFCIEKLPVSAAQVKDSVGAIEGLFFFVADRTTGSEEDLVVSVHADAEGKLTAVVGNTQAVALGRRLGDTFKLGIQWNLDHSVSVYVDDMLLATVTDATRNYQYSISNEVYGVRYNSTLPGDVKFTVSGAVIKNAIPITVAEEFNAENLFTGVDLTAVTEDLILPEKFQTAYLGELPITWESSNPAVIANNGTVTRPAGRDAVVTLTAKSGSTVLGTVEVTVKKNGMAVDDSYVIFYAADESSISVWNYVQDIMSNESQANGQLAAYWCADKLFVKIKYENASSLTLTVNGTAVPLTLDGSGEQVFSVPMAAITEYNQTVKLQATLTDAGGKAATLAKTADTLHLALQPQQLAALSMYASSLVNLTDAGGVLRVDNTFTTAVNAAGQSVQIAQFNGTADLRSQNVLLQQTVCIEKLPATAAEPVAAFGEAKGLYFYLCDRTDSPARTDNIMQAVFHADADGKLSLVIGKSAKVIDLGVKLGETFTLGTQWNQNDSVDVYVNNVYIDTVTDGVYAQNYAASQEVYGLQVRNIEGEVKASFSDKIICSGIPASVATEVDLESLFTADLSAVRKDLTLPTVVSTQYLGELPLTWTSSNTAVIANNGAVTRPEGADINVILTAKIGSKQLGTVTAVVKDRNVVLQDLTVPAFYAETATTASQWEYVLDFVVDNDTPSGKLGAFWNKSKLYIGVAYEDAVSMTLKVDGKNIPVTLDGTGMQVIPVDIAITDYNQKITVQATLTDASGNVASVARDKATLVASIHSNADDPWLVLNKGTYASGGYTNGFTITPTEIHLEGAVYKTTVTGEDGNPVEKLVYDGVAAEGVTVQEPYKGSFSAGSTPATSKAYIDHRGKDVMWQQTITVNKLPVSEPAALSAGPASANGFIFYMSDRYDFLDNSMTFTLHNTGNGLVLYMPATGDVFDLGVKLGEAFTLGTQWNRNGSVDVYLNGLLLKKVENGTLETNQGFGWFSSNSAVYSYYNLEGQVDITITEASLSAGIPATLAEELTPENLLAGIDLNAVRANITLPTSYTSSVFGECKVTWTSSNPRYLTAAGVVTRPEYEDEKVYLTASYEGAALWTQEVTVKLGTLPQFDELGALFTANPDSIVWDYTHGIKGNDSGPVGGVSAYWNTENLYVGMEYGNATEAILYINGKTFSTPLDANSITMSMAIPLAELGITNLDYNMSIPFRVVLKNSSGTNASAAEGAGKLSFSLPAGRELYAFPLMINNYAGGVQNFDYITTEGKYVFDTETTLDAYTSITTTVDADGNPVTSGYLSGKTHTANIDHYVNDLLAQVTLRIDALPEETFTYDGLGSNGYLIYLVDRVQNNGLNCKNMIASIVNEGGALVLHLGNTGKFIDLGMELGDKFVLGMQWNMDDSVDVYVNHVYKGSVENVTTGESYTGNDSLSFRYNSLADAVKVTASEVSVCDGIPVNRKEELSKKNLLGNQDLSAIRGNITLPATYKSPYVGEVSVTWKSSKPSVIAPDGTVNRPKGADETVTLTLVYKDEELWSVDALVKSLTAPQSDLVKAYHTANVGSIVWNYGNGFAGSENAPIGALDAYWDKDNLYVGVEYTGAKTLKIHVGGKEFSYQLEEGTSNAVFTIPWSQSEVDIVYNAQIPFYAQLVGENAVSTTAAADKGKLTFLIPVTGTYKITQKVNEPYSYNFFVDAEADLFRYDGLTNGNGETTVTDEALLSSAVIGWDQQLMKHDLYDLMLQQTFHVEALPVTVPAFTEEACTTTSNGLTFFFGDRGAGGYHECRLFLASLNNTVDGLVLYVANGSADGTDTSGTIVKLGKKVGDTFTLGTQWNTDNTVDIYVDGIYLTTLEDVTRIYNNGVVNQNATYIYANDGDDARITVSNAVIGRGIPLTYMDELTALNVLGGQDLSAVRRDISLPTSYLSPYIGVLEGISWTTSNAKVITANGKITRPAGDDVTAVVTATYNGTVICSVPVTIKGTATKGSAVENSWHTMNAANMVWENDNAIVDAAGKVVGGVQTAWDKDYLYVSYDLYKDYTSLQIKVANKTVNVTLDAVAKVAESETASVEGNAIIGLVKIPVAEVVDWTKADYNCSVDFSVGVAGAEDAKGATAANGKLYFRIPTPTTTNYSFPLLINNYEGGVYNVDYTTTEGVYVFDTEKKIDAFTSVNTSSYGRMILGGKGRTELIDHYLNDVLVEQTIRIDAMPSATYKYDSLNSTGLTLYLVDRVNNNINNCLTMYASIVNEHGKLVLHLANTGKSVDLGVGLGETFKLGLQWNMNDSVDVYIDGIYNTTIADVTVVDAANGNDNLTYSYNNLSDEVKITLTDVAVYEGIPATIVGELSQVNVLSSINMDKVLADLALPTSYESAYIGTIPGISWKSGNASYITDAGKVTRPSGADVQVGLTAIYKKAELWTAIATVKAVSPVRAEIAAFNTTATSASDIDWNYTNGFTGGEGAPTGGIGAAWTPDALLLGVEYKNATKLTVYANGKSFEFALKASTNLATMSIPLSQIVDVSKLDYNQSIPFYAVLSNGAASASTASANDGKLYFALKATEGMNVGQKANTSITTNFSVDPLSGVIVFDNTTNANGATTITDKNKDNLFVTGWDKVLLDHDDNDIMLEQTFYIEALPKSKPTFINETGTTSTNGFTFFFGDRGAGDWQDIRIALFSIHNTDKGLALYVADGSVGATYPDGTVIYLNRQVGDTFTLGTQWNKDNSVDVYLDGAYLRTVKSVTRAYQNAQVNFNLYYRYANLSGDARITITKAFFGKGIPKDLADEVQIEKLFDGVDPNAVRGDLPMGTTYKSPYLGEIPAQWISSDPAVIDPLTGKVTRSFEKDIQVTLTLKLRGVEMWTKTVTVKKAHEAQKNELVAMHTMKPLTTAAGVFSGTNWSYANGIVGNTQNVYGNISAMWDKDNIYLGMEYVGAKTATFVVNGKTITVDLENGTSDIEGVIVAVKKGLAEIVIPMSAIKLKLLDYERTVKFRVTLSDGTNTAFSSAAEGKGYIRFTTPSSVAFYLNLGQEKPDLQTPEGSAGFDEPYFKDGGTIGGGKVVYSVDDNETHTVSTRAIAAINHNRNQQLDQTICVTEMPVTQIQWTGVNIANGYYFYMADRAINPNKAATSSYARMVYNVLHHVGDGKLALEVSGGSAEKQMSVDLGVKIGQTFTLSTVWEADDTYIVYVNGKKIAEFEDMTFLAAGYGQDMLMMGYRDTIPGQATLTVSDVKITNLPYTSINQEVNAVSVFKDEVPTMLEDDIELPKTYESIFLGELPLSWKSAQPEYLSNTGKVTRPFGVPNGVNVDLTMSIVGLREMFTVSPLVKSAAAESVAMIQAAFSEAQIQVDGVISDEGWSLNTNTRTEGGKQTANFGVQWDLDHLYIAVKTENISAMKLTLGEQNISLGKAGVEYVTKDGITEIKIPFSNLGIVVQDYGIEIPINMTVGEGVYEGTIRLTSLDWFSTDKVGYRIKGIPSASDAIPNLGVQALDAGYYFYDHYDPEVPENNLPNTAASTMLVWEKKNPGIATVVPLWPVDETYYVSFDFQAESMPVYTAAAAAPDIRRGAYGLSFYIAGHRSGPLADNPNETVLGGIYNAGEEGLQLVISGDISMKIFPLNRYVGDLFRLGIACDPEGDVTVFCDGEEIGYIEQAEKKLTGMCSWGCDGAVTFAMGRDQNAPQSEADNFDMYITNFAFGLYYGDELLDSLTFDEFGDLNCNKYWDEEEELSQVMMDIEILSEFANNQLTRPVKLTWESANEEIVNSKTGKVTRPETNGQLVPFTCTTEAGKTKTFDMYVKGMNPDDKYMWVYRDIGAYKNPGEVVDVYKFTLDQDNNSIIYNQKESKPFNVVKLTDGDDVARLHTDFLELFVSDDNVTYTQIKDYKLLQVGCNWYLYGFEAQGQYIKVHYTLWNEAEADMEGLLQGFITAYHEEEFGQNDGTFANTTEYILTNDTGKDAQDEAWKIPVSELGDIFATETYADTRVYLDGTILYHYYEDGNIVVRVPALAKGDSVKLTIKSGNASAMDISNKEYVHEIIYGTREVYMPSNYYQNRISRYWTFEDGTVISTDIRSDGNGIAKQYSYDNMQTWTKTEIIPETQGKVSGMSGFSWDDYNDRLVMYTYSNGGQAHVFFTSDQGATWTHYENEDRTCGCPSSGAYVNGLTVSTNDGEGPGVDFIYPSGRFVYDENGARLGLECVTFYTEDGGRNWTESDSLYIEAPRTVRNGTLTENGLSESSMFETDDGTIILYIRWQWMNVNHFAVYYSYDHGITWTDKPVLSKIYTVNTNPVFFDWNRTPLLVWSSNAAFGGTSYRRIPVNVATFAKGDNELMDIVTLQDIYLRTHYQGMDTATQNQATNPAVNIAGDNANIGWFNNFNAVPQMLIEDFSDFMYKSKGAYDSFEGRTMKYEGWAYSYGRFEESAEVASHGNKSLFIGASSVAGRSIGYVKNGTYTMDIYCVGDDTDLKLELQNAYSNDEFVRTSPVKVVFEDGKFDAGDTVLTLNQGWNTLEFNVDLGELTATLSVNGETADLTGDICYGTRSHVTQDLETTKDIFSEVDDYAFEPEIGDFINWVRIDAKSNIYLDNFLVVDNDEVVGLESNGGIGDGEGFDLMSNLWWIILVVCLIAAVVVFLILKGKKKGTAEAADAAAEAAAQVAEVASEVLEESQQDATQ